MMKYYTHDEMLDTVVGKKGTKSRNEFETKLKAEAELYIKKPAPELGAGG